ncbi:hypothetical protein [Oceanobacter kriegii]|uniref:hypothetical protein n=1 Tax=Oceanobacter kriegii TaxID=64972 RepID=UPI00041C8DF6|nr:hypothetical protein [Oceanobacter kriegii]
MNSHIESITRKTADDESETPATVRKFWRCKLKNDTRDYMAAGNSIQVIANGVSALIPQAYSLNERKRQDFLRSQLKSSQVKKGA